MPPIILPLSGGKYSIPFGYGSHSRTSGAWSPDDGSAVRNNVPRIKSGRIPVIQWNPTIYHTFTSEPWLQYSDILAREALFETNFPEFTKVTLGLSGDGLPIYAYRLGPTNRKHFVIVGGVHGDETDGINGMFKAAEIIARQDFGDFLSEWTLFFIPIMNPDGASIWSRNLTAIGAEDPVDLDRNFNWYWDDYVAGNYPGSFSKGSSAGSAVEGQRLVTYKLTGNGGGPVDFGFLMDFHGQRYHAGPVGGLPEYRYQSRDRVFKFIGSSTSGIPYHSLTFGIDFYIWRMAAAIGTKRVRDSLGGKDFFTRRLRSRFVPSLAGYFASLGTATMRVVEMRAQLAGYEDFSSACNFRMDYILAAAHACTISRWSFKDAVLVEPATTNLIANSNFKDWPIPSSNPTGFNRGMGTADKSAPFYNHGGNSVLVTANVAKTLNVPAEYTAACIDALGSVVAVAGGDVYRIPANDNTAGSQITLVTHAAATIGCAVVKATATTVDILGGGSAAYTGALNLQTRLTTTVGAFAEVAGAGNIGTARMHAGFCDNFLSNVTVANLRGYLVGGVNNAGVRLTSFGTWNPVTTTFTASINVLPTAIAGALAVYYPPTSTVYIFGGESAVSNVDTIYSWVPGTDTFANTGILLPNKLAFLAGSYSPTDQCIYLYGGKNEIGTLSSFYFYRFTPSAGIEVIYVGGWNTLDGNIPDDEDLDYESSPWEQATCNWSAANLVESYTDRGTVILFGGRNVSGLVNKIIAHRTSLQCAGPIGSMLPARFKYTAGVDTPYANFMTDDFAGTLVKWTDPSTAWQISGGVAQAKTTLNGPLISATSPTYSIESFASTIGMTGAGLLADSGIVLRGTYAGAVLTDGYRVRYASTGVVMIWYLERVVATATITALATLDVSADATKQLTGVLRNISFKVEDKDPVHLTMIFNGSTIFDHYDVGATRIRTAGQAAVFGGST